MNNNPIILPLDGMSKVRALEIAEKFSGKVWGVKINDLIDQELFRKEDEISLIEKLTKICPFFADPKLHDIPNTVANRTKAYAKGGAYFITVMASGGIEMMRAAVENRGDSKILAVTVLTSLSEEEAHLTYGEPSKAKVLLFAQWAKLAGVDGIVCSAKELEILSKHPELEGLIKVTPGIRPDWYKEADDQKRTMTAGEAIKLGADYLVIGRPLLRAADPMEAVEKTLAEIEEARKTCVK